MYKFVTISLGLLVVFLVLMMAFPFGGSPLKPKVTVTFLGFTNDTSGNLARFAVTNEASFPVIRYVGYHLQAETGEHKRTNFCEGWFADQGNLQPGGFEFLLVPDSTSNPKWRLSLTMLQDISFPTLMMRKGQAKLRRALGISGQGRDYHNPRYMVTSDWISESSTTNKIR